MILRGVLLDIFLSQNLMSTDSHNREKQFLLTTQLATGLISHKHFSTQFIKWKQATKCTNFGNAREKRRTVDTVQVPLFSCSTLTSTTSLEKEQHLKFTDDSHWLPQWLQFISCVWCTQDKTQSSSPNHGLTAKYVGSSFGPGQYHSRTKQTTWITLNKEFTPSTWTNPSK